MNVSASVYRMVRMVYFYSWGEPVISQNHHSNPQKTKDDCIFEYMKKSPWEIYLYLEEK